MNKAQLRELFEGVKGDVRDYYDAQRDMLEAQKRILERVVDVAALVAADDGGVIAEGDGVRVMRAPENAGHAFIAGKCVVHPDCEVGEPAEMLAPLHSNPQGCCTKQCHAITCTVDSVRHRCHDSTCLERFGPESPVIHNPRPKSTG